MLNDRGGHVPVVRLKRGASMMGQMSAVYCRCRPDGADSGPQAEIGPGRDFWKYEANSGETAEEEK